MSKQATIVVEGLLAFAQQIFTAESFESGGTEYYGTQLLIDPNSESAKVLNATIEAVRTGAKLGKVKADRICVSDGDDTEYPSHQGMMVLRAARQAKKGRPLTVDNLLHPCVQEDNLLYSGAKARLRVNIWAQDNKWGKRINAELLVAQFIEHGDQIGGGMTPSVEGMEAVGDASNKEIPF